MNMNFYDFLADRGKIITKKKNDHLFMQGGVDRSFYYIKSGLLKVYYISEEGNESVKSFLLAGNVITNLTCSYLKEPCSYSVVCLEPSTLIMLDFEEFYQRSLEDHSIARTIINFLFELVLKKERREYEFLCLSAEKRFDLLQEKTPELLERVTQNDIARYLGITPVALSRIKNR